MRISSDTDVFRSGVVARIATALVGVLAAALIAGCGDTGQTVVKTVTVEHPAAAPSLSIASTAPAKKTHRSSRAKASSRQAATNARPDEFGFIRCDANIRARAATTTCGFAENAFYEYWTSGESESIRAYSPATGSTFDTSCTPGEGWVVCTTDDRGAVKFPQEAVSRYTQDQADAYAANHDTGGSSEASRSSSDSTPQYAEPAPSDSGSFCETHDCIDNYSNGNGSTVQCADGTYSHSGGIQGACSRHGGVG